MPDREKSLVLLENPLQTNLSTQKSTISMATNISKEFKELERSEPLLQDSGFASVFRRHSSGVRRTLEDGCCCRSSTPKSMRCTRNMLPPSGLQRTTGLGGKDTKFRPFFVLFLSSTSAHFRVIPGISFARLGDRFGSGYG